jgi:predicted transcriptional regulator
MDNSAALISIQPEYATKILAGEKKLEFRRRWTARTVKTLVIYATAPVQRIVGLATVAGVTQGTPTQLWQLTKRCDGGITKPRLFAYLKNSPTAVAIELSKITRLPGGIDPWRCLGPDFRPPQSFRYLSQNELALITSARRR